MPYLIRSLACLAVLALSSVAWANAVELRPANDAPAPANPYAALAIGLGLSAALAGGGLWLAHNNRRRQR